jgi:hypothetical protein
MAKKRRKPKPKGIRPPTERQRKREAELAGMRMLIRQAAKTGAAEAIEHCGNFWSVSDGYKRYINYQIDTQAEALMAAVRTAVRDELARVVLPGKRRKRKP